MMLRSASVAAALASCVACTAMFSVDADPAAAVPGAAASGPDGGRPGPISGAGDDPPGAAGFETMDWSGLIPKDWDAGQDARTLGLAMLGDDDPRARAALQRLKESWGRVPVVPGLDKRRIRISGFVVPLDNEGTHRTREFLLVPYFGACIHTPPPPANQVIHVRLVAPAEGLRIMDQVWVGGTLRTVLTETELGRSGYMMDAELVVQAAASARPETHAVARMKQMLPLVLGGFTPLLIAAAILARWTRRELSRTPRELKRAARQRKALERRRRRDALTSRRLAWPQRLGHVVRRAWRDSPLRRGAR
jgi:uncharacterized protein